MDNVIPTFVVIGHTNEGKSSIVSTLVADDQISISDAPRTTKECQVYKVYVLDEHIFTLIDTPGFENAPRMERWMRSEQKEGELGIDVLRRFLDIHKDDPRFLQEYRLLQPVLNGAGVLYVIDGSHPYRPKYEKELEILRLSGRGMIGLINDKDNGQYVDEWRTRLRQWCSLTRYFNAHKSNFQNRLELLSGLRELYDEWRSPIDHAISCLQNERSIQYDRAAELISNMLIEMVSTRMIETVRDDQELRTLRKEIENKFHDKLRDIEQKCRRKVELIFRFQDITLQEEVIAKPIFEHDLFSEEVFAELGLTINQVLFVSSVTGGVTGGTVDAFVGGASFGTGAVLGTLLGGAAGVYYLSERLQVATLVKDKRWNMLIRKQSDPQPTQFQIGPHRNPNFGAIILDRAILHTQSIMQRSHGNRSELDLSDVHGIEAIKYTKLLDNRELKSLEKIFAQARKKGKVKQGDQIHLIKIIRSMIE